MAILGLRPEHPCYAEDLAEATARIVLLLVLRVLLICGVCSCYSQVGCAGDSREFLVEANKPFDTTAVTVAGACRIVSTSAGTVEVEMTGDPNSTCDVTAASKAAPVVTTTKSVTLEARQADRCPSRLEPVPTSLSLP